jgi:hypothetical protein
VDLTAQIIDAITAWLQTVATALISAAFAAVGELIFSTPALDQIPEVHAGWSLVLGIANSLFVLAILAAGILVMASGTVESRYSAKLLVSRLALAGIAANASLALTGALIQLDNALVTGLLGADPAARTVADLVDAIHSAHPVNQYVSVIVGLWAAALAMFLVALYIGRDLALLLATVAAPLALATYALPQTDEIARLWVRAFCGLLFVQVVQAVLVLVALQLLRRTDWLGGGASDLVSGLMLIALLYLLVKLPFAAYHWAFRQTIRQGPLAEPVVLAARVTRALS